jgi:hypothetical protein
VKETVTPPLLMVNVSPAVNAFAVIVPDQPKFPAELADQPEAWVQSSDPATDVHCNWAEVATEPADAAAHVPCLRVVSTAAFAVPFAPGAPTCGFTHGYAATNESNSVFAAAADNPSATGQRRFRIDNRPRPRRSASITRSYSSRLLSAAH